MTVKLYSKHCRHPHLTWHLGIFLTVVGQQLQKTYTFPQIYMKGLVTKEIKQKLLDPAISHCIRMSGRRRTEDLINLLSLKLAECQIFTCQKLRLFQLILPLRHVVYQSLHGFPRGWSSHCLNILQKPLQRNLKVIKPSFESASLKYQKSEGAVFEVKGTSYDTV